MWIRCIGTGLKYGIVEKKKYNYFLLGKILLKRFHHQYPQFKDLTLKQFREVIFAFNNTMQESIVQTRDGVELPQQMGKIWIGVCGGGRFRPLNKYLTKRYGKPIYFMNLHTDGYMCKIYYSNWTGNGHSFPHGFIWELDAYEFFRRKTSSAFRRDWKKYAHSETYHSGYLRQQAFLRAERKKQYSRKELMSGTHNEFDL